MSETGPMRAGQRIANVIAEEFKGWVADGCPAVEEPDDWRKEFDVALQGFVGTWQLERAARAIVILADRIERLEQGP